MNWIRADWTMRSNSFWRSQLLGVESVCTMSKEKTKEIRDKSRLVRSGYLEAKEGKTIDQLQASRNAVDINAPARTPLPA